MSGEDKEVVAQAIDVCEEHRVDVFDFGEPEDVPFGSAANCAREVCESGGFGATGEDESVNFRSSFVEGVDPLFDGVEVDRGESGDTRLGVGLGLCGEVSSEVEHHVLDVQELSFDDFGHVVSSV